MNNKRNEVLKNDVYFVALAIYLVSTTISNTTIPIDSKYLLFCNEIASLLVIIKCLFFQKYEIKSLFILILFTGISGIVFFQTRSYSIIFLTIFLIGAYDIDFNRINKLYFLISIILFSVIIVLAKTGQIDNLNYSRGLVHRESLGMIYPTHLFARFFYLILSYFFMIKRKFNFFETVFILLSTFYFYQITDGRLSLYLSVLLVFIGNFYPLIVNNKKIIGFFTYLFSPIVVFLSFYTSYFYNASNNFLIWNRILSNRLALAHQGFTNFKVTLFGQKLEMRGYGGKTGMELSRLFDQSSYNYIDAGWLNSLFKNGVIFTILIFCLIYKKVIESKSLFFTICVCLVILESFIDESLLNPSQNIFILSLFASVTKIKKA